MLSKMLSSRRLALASICLSIAVLPQRTRSEEPTDQAVHAAIDRSLRFIEERGQWWIEEKDCVSCHRVDMMVWSLTAARAHGFDVSDTLTEWTDWAGASSRVEETATYWGTTWAVLGLLATLPDPADAGVSPSGARP